MSSRERESEPDRPTGDYPSTKKEGSLDPHQKWVEESYREMVSFVVRHNPALNINKITEKVVEIRDKWPEMIEPYRKSEGRKLPKGKPTRKTVSKHLRALQNENLVVEVGGLFLSAFDYLQKYSVSLDESVLKLLAGKAYDKWSFTPAAKVAGCYTFSDPPPRLQQEYQAMTQIQRERFKDDLFWLDDILRCAIGAGKMSSEIYSDGTIDVKLLKKGWKKFFQSTRLIVFAMAVNPPEFLEFLTTSPGRTLFAQRLQRNWDQIRKDVDADVERYGLKKIEWSDGD